MEQAPILPSVWSGSSLRSIWPFAGKPFETASCSACITGVIFEPYNEKCGPDVVLAGAVPRMVTLAPDWTFDENELAAVFGGRRALALNRHMPIDLRSLVDFKRTAPNPSEYRAQVHGFVGQVREVSDKQWPLAH